MYDHTDIIKHLLLSPYPRQNCDHVYVGWADQNWSFVAWFLLHVASKRLIMTSKQPFLTVSPHFRTSEFFQFFWAFVQQSKSFGFRDIDVSIYFLMSIISYFLCLRPNLNICNTTL